MKKLIKYQFGTIEVELIKEPTSSERGHVKITMTKDRSTEPVILTIENGRCKDMADLLWI